MGSERFYPEEAPVREAKVAAFWMDAAPVTNTAFAAFVAATGYVTVAEILPRAQDYPGLLPEMAWAGSTVFDNTLPGLDETNPGSWWVFKPGACWRHPLGSGSGIAGLEQHPVVHIAYADAAAYAHWAGKQLPTEAEWEFAARGGLAGADYAWGNTLAPGEAMLANYWQGYFPFKNDLLDGWARTSPVCIFPANPYGLHDLIGNVWEWTSDAWSLPGVAAPGGECCSAKAARAAQEAQAARAAGVIARKVIKGGSHLCAENYCRRYRPAARHPQAVDTGTSHIGFRCVRRLLASQST
jgi:formylglycine-generating enzyme required for sulfatase activity